MSWWMLAYIKASMDSDTNEILFGSLFACAPSGIIGREPLFVQVESQGGDVASP